MEKANRGLKRALVLLLVGATGTGLVAAVAGSIPVTIGLLLTAVTCLAFIERNDDEFPHVVRAGRFEVVGVDGSARVVVGETIEGIGAVAAYDSDGRFVAGLHSGAPGRQGTGKPGSRSSADAGRTGVAATRVQITRSASAPVRVSRS